MSDGSPGPKTWLAYWNLKEDPFSMLELSYRYKEEFDKRFVRTSEAEQLDEIVRDLNSTSYGAGYIIEGGYGSGKSTLLNYVARFCSQQSSKMLPVYAKIQRPDSVNDSGECSKRVDDAIYHSIRNFLDTDFLNAGPGGETERERRIVMIRAGEAKFSEHTEFLDWLIPRLKEMGYRLVFLIDEIDKIQPKVAQAYISSYQTLGEPLWLEGHATFWTVHSDWELLGNPSGKFSFIKERVAIPRWGMVAIIQLIDKRIESASRNGVRALDVFENEALEELFLASGGQPREAQKMAKAAMKLAFASKEPKVSRKTADLLRRQTMEGDLYDRLGRRIIEFATSNEQARNAYHNMVSLMLQNHDVVILVSHLAVYNQIRVDPNDPGYASVLSNAKDQSKVARAVEISEANYLVSTSRTQDGIGTRRKVVVPSTVLHALLQILVDEAKRAAEAARVFSSDIRMDSRRRKDWTLETIMRFFEFQLSRGLE